MEKATIKRFLLGLSDEQERQQVAEWLLDPENEDLLQQWLQNDWRDLPLPFPQHLEPKAALERVWNRLEEEMGNQIPRIDEAASEHRKSKSRKRIYLIPAAAILILVLGLSWLLQIPSGKSPAEVRESAPLAQKDVMPPAESRAVLTLEDGRRIYLDSTLNDQHVEAGKVGIDISPNGEIRYSAPSTTDLTYNTLTVPKGSRPIKLILADGSQVWLNAASALTYPTAFIGSDRRVDMSGEVYFEVAKNTGKPFYVKSGEMEIRVVGTHFNINAYDGNRSSKVTLLEGAVEVNARAQKIMLSPGQQAIAGPDQVKLASPVDLEEVMSWKNGQFVFPGNDLKGIMKELERFYDVQVEFRDEIPYQFVARISRDVPISSFLEKLELTNLVHFTISGNKIIITK